MKLDTNQDGQLQLAEYAAGQKFSHELYEEFLAADVNQDGVITSNEFK